MTKRNPQNKGDSSGGQRVFVGILIGLAVVVVGVVVWRNSQRAAQNVASSKDVINQLGVLNAEQPTLGSTAAKVQVVVFENFKCPNCRNFEQDVFPKIKANYIDTDKIFYGFRSLLFLGEDATTAAEAAQCVFQQKPELFWPYAEIIFRAQKAENLTWATPSYLTEIAENVDGVNRDDLRKCIDERGAREIVAADNALGRRLGVTGTPTVFVNGLKLTSYDYDTVARAIDTALE